MSATAEVEGSHRVTALDGLRGLAVVAVLLFHLWPDILPGGFLGVSVFFTLSGFVITRALLREHERTGSIRLRSFWGRRLRRLWPASAACLAVIAVVWVAVGWMNRSIGGDVLASFLQVANWRFLIEGSAYGAGDVSPVTHFWSLSIEEQLYVVVPLLVLGLRRHPRMLLAALAAAVLVSVVATVISAGDAPVVYYSTLTRAGELVVGAMLAVLVRSAPAPPGRRRVTALVGVAGAVALVTIGWFTVMTSTGTEYWYRGGLTAFALLSVLVILAALWSTPVARMLSLAPLVWLGGVSYAVYLVHWPVLVGLDQAGVDERLVPWITLVVTLVTAAASLRWLEMPVRDDRWSRPVLVVGSVTLTALVLSGSILGITSPRQDDEIDFSSLEEQLAALGEESVGVGSEGELRVAVFGDSTALTLGVGAGQGVPGIRIVGGEAGLGCPVGRGGELRGDASVGDDPTVAPRPFDSWCDWTMTWPSFVARTAPVDVALVLTGNWDLAGRRIEELGSEWVTLADARYVTWLRREIATAADSLHAAGARTVVWLTLPPVAGSAPSPALIRYNAVVRAVAASRPWMWQLDYAGYLTTHDLDARLRPDGVHLSADGSQRMMNEWLRAELERVVATVTDRG